MHFYLYFPPANTDSGPSRRSMSVSGVSPSGRPVSILVVEYILSLSIVSPVGRPVSILVVEYILYFITHCILINSSMYRKVILRLNLTNALLALSS